MYGVESLTDVELLAVLLRSGTKDVNVVNLAYNILEGNGEGFGIHSIFHHNIDKLMASPSTASGFKSTCAPIMSAAISLISL